MHLHLRQFGIHNQFRKGARNYDSFSTILNPTRHDTEMSDRVEKLSAQNEFSKQRLEKRKSEHDHDDRPMKRRPIVFRPKPPVESDDDDDEMSSVASVSN